MHTVDLSDCPCRVAVCRESLADACEWSLYAINDLPDSVQLRVEQAAWAWGDRGHSTRSDTLVTLPPAGTARILRVDDDDAELSMNLTLIVEHGGTRSRVSFELGKLYRYRDPTPVAVLGKPGWLRAPSEYRHI